jgi:hypothetical protein
MHVCYRCSQYAAVKVSPNGWVERWMTWLAGGCFQCLACKYRFFEVL